MTESTIPTINLGPDGEKVVEMDYYNVLEVPSNADAAAIKKGYRKQAMKFHPDKNPGDESAAAKFQALSEAYSVLQDPNLRAVYNRQGKSSAVAGAGGAESMPDPGQMFATMFGGAAFMDWIGEISLGKDVSKAFEMTTEDETAETVASETSSVPVTSTSTTSAIHHTEFNETKPTPSVSSPSIPTPAPTASSIDSTPSKTSPTTSTTTETASALPPSSSTPTPTATSTLPEKKGSVPRMTPEQRQKMELYDLKRQEEKRERLRSLIDKLRDRIRPFVEASNPGDAEDSETQRYISKIREQSHDLAMESFGIELCHLIGEVYMVKASSYIKLHRKASSNILGVPGWWSRVKEKGTMLKEGWSFLSVGLDIQSAMKEMEARQKNGEVDEEEMKKLEEDMSGKLLLVAWKGSKFELSTILRQVVDGVLSKEEPNITEAILMNRAKAILVTGAILKSVVADENDSERRELERMVAEAQRKRKEKGKKKSTPSGTSTPNTIA